MRGPIKLFAILAALLFQSTLAHADADTATILPSVWALGKGVVSFYPAADGTDGRVEFKPRSGGSSFSYPVGTLSVLQVVANSSGMYLLIVQRLPGGEYDFGIYSVHRCSFDGQCTVDRIFSENVDQITASEDGYYAVTYKYGDLFRGEGAKYPREASVVKVSDGRPDKVCCEAESAIIGIYYDSKRGLSVNAILSTPGEILTSSGLFVSRPDGKLTPAAGFRELRWGDRTESHPVYCEYHIYTRGAFFCISGKHIVGENYYLVYLRRLSSNWESIFMIEAASFPSATADGHLVYVARDGSYKQVNLDGK